MAPAMIGVSVAQLSLLINTQIASHVGVGAVSWLTYADRLMEFPTALLGVALGVVLLPQLSAAQARVVRDGAPLSIDAAGLVPGDVILVAEGDTIPADGEILAGIMAGGDGDVRCGIKGGFQALGVEGGCGEGCAGEQGVGDEASQAGVEGGFGHQAGVSWGLSVWESGDGGNAKIELGVRFYKVRRFMPGA